MTLKTADRPGLFRGGGPSRISLISQQSRIPLHRMYNEILDELGDLATVVSRNYVYGKIKDRTGLSIRHISRIINHTKVEEI